MPYPQEERFMAHPQRSSATLQALHFGIVPLVALIAVSACRPPEPQQDVPEASAQPEERFFTGADSVQLFYRKVGGGPQTVVYLHGGPLSMADGGYEWDALADGRTLIAFDQRSGGHSQLLGDSTLLTPEHFVRDLEALRQHFQLDQMVLMGQSWGAMVAAMYTAQHPEHVERLLLVAPGPPARNPFWPQRVEKTNGVIGESGVARIAELTNQIPTAPDAEVKAICEERFRLIFRGYLNDVAALNRMRVGYCDGTPESIRHETWAGGVAFNGLGDWDFRPSLSQLKMPALIVEGEDTYVPLDATRAWAATLPNARLLLVPGANHIVYLEGDVPRTVALLRIFLEGGWPEGAELVRP
jgi:pimeloyl-ACP methyl ester carboxylesterase